MLGDRAPATGVGRFQAPTGPGGVGPRGAGDTRVAPAAAYGCCRRTARAQEGCWRTGRTDDGSARAEARMPAVGGCMGSEHGRRAPRSRSHHSARFESRAGRPSRHAASPSAATAGRPASRRPHTGRPQFEPAQPAGRAAGRVGRAAPTWRPAGFGPRPAGWPAGFVRRPGRIWASAGRVAGRIFRAAQPDLGGRPAGFGGSASRFWGVGRPVLGGRLAGSAGRPAAHHLRLNHHLPGTGSYEYCRMSEGR